MRNEERRNKLRLDSVCEMKNFISPNMAGALECACVRTYEAGAGSHPSECTDKIRIA